MEAACRISGCPAAVPAELAERSLCLTHFLAGLEQQCADIRRETARERPAESRMAEVVSLIRETGETLSRIATGEPRLGDEMKARILNAFLTLMNLRENIERMAQRALSRRT
jgi:hypothetical protein